MSNLPTALIGFVKGSMRWEACGGDEWYGNIPSNFLFFRKPSFTIDKLKGEGPKLYAITHLQKKSKFGFLLMWPLCFHVWFTFKYQQQKLSDGNVLVDVPGSETVLYWRVGWKRWDAKNCTYIGPPTWYGPGLHWD